MITILRPAPDRIVSNASPICSSAKILLARLHNSDRTLERVKRGEVGPFTFPWELQEIARTFSRSNSAITKWRAELEACGAASYGSGSWTLPVPEFFRETRFTHFSVGGERRNFGPRRTPLSAGLRVGIGTTARFDLTRLLHFPLLPQP
jgi:hypothetical protein